MNLLKINLIDVLEKGFNNRKSRSTKPLIVIIFLCSTNAPKLWSYKVKSKLYENVGTLLHRTIRESGINIDVLQLIKRLKMWNKWFCHLWECFLLTGKIQLKLGQVTLSQVRLRYVMLCYVQNWSILPEIVAFD